MERKVERALERRAFGIEKELKWEEGWHFAPLGSDGVPRANFLADLAALARAADAEHERLQDPRSGAHDESDRDEAIASIALAFRDEVGGLTDAEGKPVRGDEDEARFVWLALGIVPELPRPKTVAEMRRLVDDALDARKLRADNSGALGALRGEDRE